MRDSHQENNGKIFAWDNPPPTGHPGEDYGCRCKAEPYTPQEAEYFHINLHDVSDQGREWSHRDFIWHYFYGNGRFIRVRDIGHLRKIVAEFRRQAIDPPNLLPGQIADAARKTNGADFTDTFDRPYRFRHIVYSFGDSVIKGRFNGRMKNNHGLLELTGQINFELSDIFRDPLQLEEMAERIKETRQKLKQLVDKYIIAAVNKGISRSPRQYTL